jgi:RNA polymerase sigma-70 factor (ECF subfamily)
MNEPASDEDATDRALLTRIARGDRDAFEDFYRRFAHVVAGYARGVCASPEIDDIVSETMLAVWRSAARHRGRSRVSTWLLAIAHHRAIDAVRRRPRNVIAFDAVRDVPATEGDPADAALRSARVRQLDAALATLSPEHRAVLELTFTHDRTQAEIATIVDAPVATVKTRVFNAKRKLREALARAGAEVRS